MKKTQVLILFLLLTTLISCTKKVKMDGFYFGEIGKENKYPTLIKFDHGKFIDYNYSPYNYFTYTQNGNSFELKNELNETSNFDIKEQNNLYSLFVKDTLISVFEKQKSTNFVFDNLKDKQIQINLPTGDTKEVNFKSHDFRKLIYLGKKDDDLVVSFKDTTMKLSADFKEFLNNYYSNDELLEFPFFNFNIIADKNIKIKDLNYLKKILKTYETHFFNYFLESSKYDKVKKVSMGLKNVYSSLYNFELAEKVGPSIPRPPLPYREDHHFKIKFSNNQLYLNDTLITKKTLEKTLKNEIENYPTKTFISFYISEDSKYQDFIDLSLFLHNIYLDFRDSYSEKIYNLKYEDLKDKSKIKDLQKKYPKLLYEIDSTSYYNFIKIK
ncbi:hypothetical protein [Aureivirga sp. CE67]|uniref:hypothetical protein n=1 Tax=Aureivirga sp. CE67 TaxID=1788983 RepID=UPI0018C95A4B|nr:hypothetical protein [Aureivirga sp. CE67]